MYIMLSLKMIFFLNKIETFTTLTQPENYTFKSGILIDSKQKIHFETLDIWV